MKNAYYQSWNSLMDKMRDFAEMHSKESEHLNQIYEGAGAYHADLTRALRAAADYAENTRDGKADKTVLLDIFQKEVSLAIRAEVLNIIYSTGDFYISQKAIDASHSEERDSQKFLDDITDDPFVQIVVSFANLIFDLPFSPTLRIV